MTKILIVSDSIDIPATDIGYVAGVLDGEGSVTIAKTKAHRQKDKYYHKYFVYVPKFCITNTNKELIEFCHNIFLKIGLQSRKYLRNLVPKGAINEGNKIRIINRRKPIWHLEIGNRRDIITILNILLPYLIEKKKAAILLLEFLNSRELSVQKKKENFGSSSYSNREREIYEEIKILTIREGKGVERKHDKDINCV